MYMPIFMTKQAGEILASVNFWALIILMFLSMVPVDLRKGYRSLSLYFPILAVFLAILYEMGARIAIPTENVPIRIDMMIVMPLIAFILLMGTIRWIIVFYLRIRKHHDQLATGRKQQTVAFLVVAAVAVSWFCLIWWQI